MSARSVVSEMPCLTAISTGLKSLLLSLHQRILIVFARCNPFLSSTARTSSHPTAYRITTQPAPHPQSRDYMALELQLVVFNCASMARNKPHRSIRIRPSTPHRRLCSLQHASIAPRSTLLKREGCCCARFPGDTTTRAEFCPPAPPREGKGTGGH